MNGWTAPDLSEAPGEMLFVLLYGSHAHGTAGPTSDEDWRGVYQLPTEDWLGLHQPKTTWERKPDTVLWELGHYARLLLGGNPNIVGMLWAPDECVVSVSGPVARLREMRTEFITRRMVSAYHGWVHTELKVGESLTGKRASHLLRLLWELDGALTTGDVPVVLPEHRRKTVVAVKRGNLDVSVALAMVRDELVRIDALVRASDLPEPPEEKVRQIVVDARKAALRR